MRHSNVIPAGTVAHRTAASVACVGLLATLASAACGPTPAREAVRVGDRQFVDAPYDTLWTHASDASAPFVTPEYLATDGRNVYVGDAGRQSIYAFDARTGALRWRTTGGSDSSAVGAPRAMTPRRTGGVVAFDADRRALVRLAPDGRVDGRTSVPAIEVAQSLCELPDGALLIAVMGSSAGLMRVSPTGAPLGVHALPWPDLGHASGLVTASLLAPVPDGCVSALALGRGFALFRTARFASPRSYVEPMALPEVVTRRETHGSAVTVSTTLTEHVMAAQDVTASADAIVIAFDGRTHDRAHVLDVYDTAGAYRMSYRTGRRVEAVAASDSALFMLVHRDGVPVVVALRWPPRARAATPGSRR